MIVLAELLAMRHVTGEVAAAPPWVLSAEQRVYGLLLWILFALFVLRVLGQMLVAVAPPPWLPPMRAWYSGVMPYRYLLPTQWIFIAVMILMIVGAANGVGPWTEPRPVVGVWIVWFSYVYFVGMVVRFVRWWRQPPEAKGVLIPIVFHVVLAMFLFVYGNWHLR